MSKVNEEKYFFVVNAIRRGKDALEESIPAIGYFIDKDKITYICVGYYTSGKKVIDKAYKKFWKQSFLKDMETLSSFGETSMTVELEANDIPYYARFFSENLGFSIKEFEDCTKELIMVGQPITFSWENATFGTAWEFKKKAKEWNGENQEETITITNEGNDLPIIFVYTIVLYFLMMMMRTL